MLRIVCLCSATVAVLAVLRWVARRVDALGRTRSFPTISVVISLLMVAATGVPVWRHARFEQQLSDVASSLAGAEVKVRCQTLSQAWTEVHPEAGYVRFGPDGRPEPTATITAQTCDDLRSWVGSTHEPTRTGAVAVHVLTHEAMHMAGLGDEALAECAAVQRDVRTAVLLGATRPQARALALGYWRDVYPQLPNAYRTGGCAAGGELDERAEDPPWARNATA